MEYPLRNADVGGEDEGQRHEDRNFQLILPRRAASIPDRSSTPGGGGPGPQTLFSTLAGAFTFAWIRLWLDQRRETSN
jgi:hypothetical protein